METALLHHASLEQHLGQYYQPYLRTRWCSVTSDAGAPGLSRCRRETDCYLMRRLSSAFENNGSNICGPGSTPYFGRVVPAIIAAPARKPRCDAVVSLSINFMDERRAFPLAGAALGVVPHA